jgi:hypothetical protein
MTRINFCLRHRVFSDITSAPAVDIVPPSRITAAAVGTVRSVRPALANAGSKPGAANSSPHPTSMSCSPCGRNWQRCPYRIKRVYSLLFRASAETLLEVARNPTHHSRFAPHPSAFVEAFN